MKSYELLEDRMKQIYFEFYQETYKAGTALDTKTKELVAIAASLCTGCQNCLEGHLKKALKAGATGAEIREAVAIAVGVSAATIVDRTDLAHFHLNISRLLDRAEQKDGVSSPGKRRVRKATRTPTEG
ncbi:MAG: carboxymuconolactone decarboxylase family protein [Candidatus Latescibacteria bacterium]|nr:carboxymuconolactone decarboxylase family protein [Candidatus Latescibacterota bacterium]